MFRLVFAQFILLLLSIATSAQESLQSKFEIVSIACPTTQQNSLRADFRNLRGSNMRLSVNFAGEVPYQVSGFYSDWAAKLWIEKFTISYSTKNPKDAETIRIAREFYEPAYEAVCRGDAGTRQRYLDLMANNRAMLPKPTK